MTLKSDVAPGHETERMCVPQQDHQETVLGCNLRRRLFSDACPA
jgi:hypothetical protein